jgi:hypothetical protein
MQVRKVRTGGAGHAGHHPSHARIPRLSLISAVHEAQSGSGVVPRIPIKLPREPMRVSALQPDTWLPGSLVRVTLSDALTIARLA